MEWSVRIRVRLLKSVRKTPDVAAPVCAARERVLQQHGDRQRPDAAGHRRQRAGDVGDRRVHVADDACDPFLSKSASRELPSPNSSTDSLAVSRRGCPDVDHDRARLDESRRHEPGRPMAATRMSASRVTAGRSGVRE